METANSLFNFLPISGLIYTAGQPDETALQRLSVQLMA